MNKMGTILLVEDDPNILRTNRGVLEWEGFAVLCARTLREARALLETYAPDALVLDIRLPDGSGLTFCEEIRTATSIPVLFLTAMDEKSEIIQGLVAGGNDYITKPYDLDEFVARLNAQLRMTQMIRQEMQTVKALSRGPLELDTVALRAYLNGEDMGLSAREFSVLLYLVKNEGRTLAAEEIYQGAWNQPMTGNPAALWTCISRLKSKLAKSQGEISLMNFRSEGYMLEVMRTNQRPCQ